MSELEVPSFSGQSRQLASVSTTYPRSQEKEYKELPFQKDSNPEMAILEKTSNKSEVMSNHSKVLLKQKDRFENNSIEKGMFNAMEESMDEIKVASHNSSRAQISISE